MAWLKESFTTAIIHPHKLRRMQSIDTSKRGTSFLSGVRSAPDTRSGTRAGTERVLRSKQLQRSAVSLIPVLLSMYAGTLMGCFSPIHEGSPFASWRCTRHLHRSRCLCLAHCNIMVGASGFEPPSSWSRTSLYQAKSVELTAFACAFPRLIWATWATKYRRRISGCSPSRMYQ